MKNEELIALAKELASLTDLSAREGDLVILKREYDRIKNKDEESLADTELKETLKKYIDELAPKASILTANSLEEKKALLKKAEALLEREDIMKAGNELNAIFEEFKKAGRCSKEEDDQLWATLKDIREKFGAKKKAYFEELNKKNAEKRAQKAEIIDKAKKVLEIENFKEATAQMDALMEEWKKVGFSGKEGDDSLWSEFSSARKAFFTKRKAHFEEMKKLYVERVAKKEELIKQVRFFVADAKFDREEIAKIKEFREAWKAIGFSGKEKDEVLYQEFNGLINQYFEERKEYSGK